MPIQIKLNASAYSSNTFKLNFTQVDIILVNHN